MRSHKKFGPDSFSLCDVYWIQTNRQTPRQAKYIHIEKKIPFLVINKIEVCLSKIRLNILRNYRN